MDQETREKAYQQWLKDRGVNDVTLVTEALRVAFMAGADTCSEPQKVRRINEWWIEPSLDKGYFYVRNINQYGDLGITGPFFATQQTMVEALIYGHNATLR